MSSRIKRRLIIKLVVLCVLISGLAWYASGTASWLSAGTSPQTFTVSILPQQDSPLQLVAVNVRSADPFSPGIDFAVVNRGAVSVRAFTVSREISPGGLRAATVTHMTSQKDVLQPGQSKVVTVNEGAGRQAVESIALSVDYVEFTDGSTWGDDTFKSAPRLAGQRAGGRAALDHFRRLIERKESAALMKSVEEDHLGAPSLDASTPEWNEGFDTGVGAVRQRLRKAWERGGADEVKAELRKPFDASEGRP